MVEERRYCLLILLLCFSVAYGCGSNPPVVAGIVMLDNEPLTTGTVTFHHKNGGGTAYGNIDPVGRFTLRSANSAEIALGDYKVTVIALESPTEIADPHGMSIPGKSITPLRYASAQSTDLTANISAGKNEVNLNLLSK